MYHENDKTKFNNRQIRLKRQRRRRHHNNIKILLISLLFVAFAAVGTTIAFLFTSTKPVVNTFTPSSVSCKVEESYDKDKHEKSKVYVTNTSNIEAYIRVRLVTYRVNDSNQQIGGKAEIPTFNMGEGWVKYGDYYYYTLPVSPAESENDTTNLIDSITLKTYTDTDGGEQSVEVMAEAIQSKPAEAVGEAWGVSISKDSVTEYKPNSTTGN